MLKGMHGKGRKGKGRNGRNRKGKERREKEKREKERKGRRSMRKIVFTTVGATGFRIFPSRFSRFPVWHVSSVFRMRRVNEIRLGAVHRFASSLRLRKSPESLN